MMLLSEHPEIGMGRSIYVKGVIRQMLEGVDISDRGCPLSAPCSSFLYLDDPSPNAASQQLSYALVDASRHGEALDAIIQVQVMYKRRPGGPWKLRYLRLLNVVAVRYAPHLW
jgi:hypothetical protein